METTYVLIRSRSRRESLDLRRANPFPHTKAQEDTHHALAWPTLLLVHAAMAMAMAMVMAMEMKQEDLTTRKLSVTPLRRRTGKRIVEGRPSVQ
jgi:hypothetical protein